MSDAPEETPEVTILLLGDAECGKSTFLSRISKGSTSHDSKEPITLLRDNDQPFIFDIKFFNRPYRFQFYDTSSPEHWTTLSPDVVVVCYDISQRLSLINVGRFWTREMLKVFDDTKDLPVLLLGLKRDLRSEKDPNGIIYPAEGHKVAQECRMDRYMECSAVSGELVHEVFEDICRTAAMSLKEGGGLSEGGCEVM